MKLRYLATALAVILVAPALAGEPQSAAEPRSLRSILVAPEAAAEPETISLRQLAEFTGMTAYGLRAVFMAQDPAVKYSLAHQSYKRDWVRALDRLADEGYGIEFDGQHVNLIVQSSDPSRERVVAARVDLRIE
jgi:hypothetical protein